MARLCAFSGSIGKVSPLGAQVSLLDPETGKIAEEGAWRKAEPLGTEIGRLAERAEKRQASQPRLALYPDRDRVREADRLYFTPPPLHSSEDLCAVFQGLKCRWDCAIGSPWGSLMRLRPAHFWFSALLLVVLLSNELSAQTTTSGGLTGVVTDPSHAVVQGADVEITDTAKGTARFLVRRGKAHFFYYGAVARIRMQKVVSRIALQEHHVRFPFLAAYFQIVDRLFNASELPVRLSKTYG